MHTSPSEYDELIETIRHHDRLYYVENAPVLLDEEYDALCKQLEQIEAQHPEWVTPDSPTQRVGESLVGGFAPVTHQEPMLSLANTYSFQEVQDFLSRAQKNLGHTPYPLCAELKMDGIAVTCRYEKGVFVLGATRGNGRQGDDITQNLKTISSLPLRVATDLSFEVRGEVFMPKHVFMQLNREKKEKGDPEYANPRNAASGSLKLLDPHLVKKRGLRVVFYGVTMSSPLPCQTQHEVHAFLHSLGFPTLECVCCAQTLVELQDFIMDVGRKRAALSYEIDGVVVKLNALSTHAELGSVGKSPRWAVAYKYAAEKARARVLDIHLQVGRTGVVTPVAQLSPTLVSGSTISRATLHNMQEISRLDVRIGDEVVVEKGGDVIPKVVEVIPRQPRHEMYQMPLTCPSCGTPLVHEDILIRCPHLLCPEQTERRIVHFVSKQAMRIEGLGLKIIRRLLDLGLIRSPADIYKLTTHHLIGLEGFQEKSVSNLLDAIENSKQAPLDRFLFALGIRHIGTLMARELAQEFGSLEGVIHASFAQIEHLHGFGQKSAQAVCDFFRHPLYAQEVADLLEAGVLPQSVQSTSSTHHFFSGKLFVMTGTLQKYGRQQARELIASLGGRVSDSLSKKTDVLLVGDNPGSKKEKAKKYGVRLMLEEEFEEMLHLSKTP